jgi:hypothetical protein
MDCFRTEKIDQGNVREQVTLPKFTYEGKELFFHVSLIIIDDPVKSQKIYCPESGSFQASFQASMENTTMNDTIRA